MRQELTQQQRDRCAWFHRRLHAICLRTDDYRDLRNLFGRASIGKAVPHLHDAVNAMRAIRNS